MKKSNQCLKDDPVCPVLRGMLGDISVRFTNKCRIVYPRDYHLAEWYTVVRSPPIIAFPGWAVPTEYLHDVVREAGDSLSEHCRDCGQYWVMGNGNRADFTTVRGKHSFIPVSIMESATSCHLNQALKVMAA